MFFVGFYIGNNSKFDFSLKAPTRNEPHMRKRILISLVSFSIILFNSQALLAQSYQLHSVFLYSFTRYVQWPDEMNHGDFDILVFGDSPITPELKKMADVKKVGDRAIKVYSIKSAAELRKCNILFIPASKSGQLAEILTKVGSNAVLVVTEQDGLGAKGSGINFITKEGKLAFEMNQAAMTKQKLKASTELTRLAIVI